MILSWKFKGGIYCADYEAAASFLGFLPKLNEGKGYWPELMRQGSSANISSHVAHETNETTPGFKAAKDRYHLYILLECCLWLYAKTYAQLYVNEPSCSKMQKN
jgi:hypothetical protein